MEYTSKVGGFGLLSYLAVLAKLEINFFGMTNISQGK